MTSTQTRLNIAAIQGLARAIAQHGYTIECAAGHFTNPARAEVKKREAAQAREALAVDLLALEKAFAQLEESEQ
jgi:hypothetical protein